MDSISRKKKKCIEPIHGHNFIHKSGHMGLPMHLFEETTSLSGTYTGIIFFILYIKRLNNSETEMTYLRGKVN